MSKVLVTGSAGYLANILIPELMGLGHTVIGIDNLMYNHKQSNYGRGFEFHNVDVRDKQVVWPHLQKVDIVIPCAALVGMPVCNRLPKEATETNFEAIEQMVGIMSPNQRLIYLNSNSAYGKGGPIALTEDSPVRPLSLYAQTKMDGERVAMKHPQATTFRLATVFGVSSRMRLDLLVNDFTYKAFFEKRVCLYEPHFRRNYVHIKDVARILIASIERSDMHGQVYNLGCDEVNCTKKELALQIAKHLDFNIIMGTGHKKDPDGRDYIVSSAKLACMGFKARLDLDYGINELINLFSTMPKRGKERGYLVRGCKNA